MIRWHNAIWHSSSSSFSFRLAHTRIISFSFFHLHLITPIVCVCVCSTFHSMEWNRDEHASHPLNHSTFDTTMCAHCSFVWLKEWREEKKQQQHANRFTKSNTCCIGAWESVMKCACIIFLRSSIYLLSLHRIVLFFHFLFSHLLFFSFALFHVAAMIFFVYFIQFSP